jgi:putative SOS response-associated peptidase YedK
MCGRYARRSDKQKIAEAFAVHGPVLADFGPSWNVAPQTFQPVIRLNRDTGEREIVLMRWGLIPFWILLANSGGTTEVSEKRTSQAQQDNFRVARDSGSIAD